ncbi:reverse transcriptase family protein [Pseudomonas sp. X10]
MTKAKIDQIHDIAELSVAVGTRPERLLEYMQAQCQADYYQILNIPKRGRGRSGEFRQVYKAQDKWLANLHRSIAMIVANSVCFEQHVQGFLKGRSTISNAALHLNKDVVVHADIKDFFNSITESQVFQAFVSLGGDRHIAELLARLCTIDGYLLQGTRCSPVISNIACRKLDLDMLELARVTSSTYSRYADNITFSGSTPPASPTIKQLVEASGFTLRGSGCYIQYRGARQFVTGLSVVDHAKPRLPKQMKRKLRLIAYFINKYGDDHFHFSSGSNSIAPSRAQFEGFIAYAHSVEPQFAKKLWAMID